MQTYAYGFPHLGRNREFKKNIESFWENKIEAKELISALADLEQARLNLYKSFVDTFPLGEFTCYDNILDTAFIFGVYKFKNLKDYFEYARGKYALEMKKYFNTNYHYLVPRLGKNPKFHPGWNKPLSYFKTSFSFKDRPLFLIGPYTFLKLSRLKGKFEQAFSKISSAYRKLLDELVKEGVCTIHLEEPSFCTDIPRKEVSLIIKNYKKIIPLQLKVNLITYYESVDFLDSLYELPLNAIGLDFITGYDNLNIIKKKGFPKDKKLICGVINGRLPDRADIFSKVRLVESIKKAAELEDKNIIVSNSSPLFHLPFTLDNESSLAEEIKGKVSFAKEKLYELSLIKKVACGDTKEAKDWSKPSPDREERLGKKKFSTLSLSLKTFSQRKKLQQSILKFPLFPTTTIGSFPQDKELRKIRLEFIKGRSSLDDYSRFIRNRIDKLIDKEKEIGLDALVHGEFERTDMVEFFAQKLKGFLTTDSGWVISYGTRTYRPPIIYGRIERDSPLTLQEIFYAQSLTSKPVKGIFTGPITIIAWSYNLREDPIYQVAFEIAEALNKEAKELIKNGIKIIQIDEPAIKEYSPLKKRKRDFYFSWAIRAFNLVAQLPKDVQVHTHLCYSEFGEIIKWIIKMNFDVITIEAAREKAKIIDDFKKVKFNRAIGPGVWDIHSKYPAKEKTIAQILKRSIKVFGAENIWVNPDCGLKTRKWPEVEISLKRLVKVANKLRKQFKSKAESTI